MDDICNTLAQELSQAIARAVAEDPRVTACQEQAREQGFDMRVSLEAVIGFAPRIAVPKSTALAPSKPGTSRPYEVSKNDKRFLRALRITADDQQNSEVE